jgi:hypothetical protein
MICGGIGAGFRGTAQVMAKGHDDSKGSSVWGSMYMARELHVHITCRKIEKLQCRVSKRINKAKKRKKKEE